MTGPDTSLLLDQLRQILAPKRVVGIRTDYTVSETGVSRRMLVIERHHAGNKFAILSPREGLRERGIKALKSWLGLSEEEANQALDAAHALSEINDMGAWPLATDAREAVEVNFQGVNGEGWKSFPGFRSRFNSIRDLLPDVAKVAFLTNCGQNAQGATRKNWVHLYNHDGDLCVALALNALNGALRNWFGPDEKEHGDADARLGRWAHQAGVRLDDFIDAMMTLVQFESILGATELDLTREAGLSR